MSWASPFRSESGDDLEGLFLDIWDGFPAEREELMGFLHAEEVENLIFVTGDFHTSLAFEVRDPVENSQAIGVEFTTPSLNSANTNEHVGNFMGSIFEILTQYQFLFNHPNPHLKYVDLDRHGYLLLTLTEEQVRADYYFLDNVLQRDSKEHWGGGMIVRDGSPVLSKAPSPKK